MSLYTELFGGRDKKSVNSSNKGKVNERAVVKWLELWVGEQFARVPQSGGLHWKNNSSVYGDVVCTNEDFKFLFNVETKHYNNFNFAAKLGSRSPIYKIWEQSKRDAENSKKIPMLMLRYNGMPKNTWMVFFDRKLEGLRVESEGDKYKIYGYHSNELLVKLPYKKLIDIL